jgi:molybdenum cofactor cytidylyltransferase
VFLKANNNKIAAILLAAGESRRLGRPKQLLIYKNGYLINYILEQIKKGGIIDINVVLGSCFDEIKNQIVFKDINIYKNYDWEEGVSSSIKCGLNNLKQNIQAVIFFIVDQPYLEPKIILEVIEKFKTSNAKIIATQVAGVLTHPILFKRELFPKLLELKGDLGGKVLFKNDLVETVDWGDKRLLLDIDSNKDYEGIIQDLL